MPDHYTYPGSDVLVNIPGYTHPAAWHAAETAAIGVRMAELRNNPVEGSFDLAHLRAIHRYLTQDLYTWGGQLRDTDTGPGRTGIAHCRPAFIPAEAERIFTTLASVGHLRDRDTDALSEGLAWVWGETTVLHPFRDVNTRSQFVFFSQLAASAGWVIDWTRIDPYVFAHARTVAIVRDEKGIDALLRPALVSLDTIARHDELREKMDRASEAFFTPRPRRTPRQFDAALTAALKEHAPHLRTPPEPGRGTQGTPPPGHSLDL